MRTSFIAIALCASCGSSLVGVPPDDAGQTGGGSGAGGRATGSSGSGGASSGGAGGGSSGGAGGGSTCAATCATPAGTVQGFSSVEEVYAALVGLWQICPGAGRTFPTAPPDTIGVEYGPASPAPTPNGSTAGGNMYYLVQGAAGPVRGAGFDYQLTYDVSPEGPGAFQLNMHPAPNSGFGGTFRYSPCPREFEISGGSANPGDRAILVPFD
jgi:hypothetical protein